MKNKKLLTISVVVVLLGSVFLGVHLAKAQHVPLAGGTSFETATLIQPGEYQGGSLNRETGLEKYYFIQGVKPGQEVKIRGVFKPDSTTYGTIDRINLYDENRKELVDIGKPNSSSLSLFPSWLPNSNQPTYKYYIKIADEGLWHTESFTLNISLVDRYDAGSQTDAGDDFNKALTVTAPGSYQGYLAGCYDYLPFNVEEGGTDFKDFYKISAKKGQTLTFKVTPSSGAEMELAVYNTKRQLVKTESASNKGAIILTSLNIINNGDVLVAAICGDDCSSKLVAYTLDIETVARPEEKPVIGGEGNIQSPAGDQQEKPVVGGEGDAQPPAGDQSEIPEDIKSEPTSEQLGDEYLPSGLGIVGSGSAFNFSKMWGWMVGYLVLWIFLYVYLALCLYFIAQKTNTPDAWLAWIPIANIILMLQIAEKPLWWLALIFLPLVNIVVGVIVWMKIAERMNKPSWWGILTIVPGIGILVPGYLAFSDGSSPKVETTEPYIATGTEAANKPTVGYKHACKYCGKMIPPNSTVCPFCGKVNPLGPFRCPKCHEPIKKEWKVCSNCGQNLRIVCPFCGKVTFFGDYCDSCGARLLVKCPYCGQEQPPLSDYCIKCGKPLFKKR